MHSWNKPTLRTPAWGNAFRRRLAPVRLTAQVLWRKACEWAKFHEEQVSALNEAIGILRQYRQSGPWTDALKQPGFAQQKEVELCIGRNVTQVWTRVKLS